MTLRPRLSLNQFIHLVVAAAVVGLVYEGLTSRGQALLGPQPQLLAIFAGCCFVTELRPLRWLRRDEGGEVTASWTFMMAMLLVAPALAATVIAAAIFLV